MTCPSCQAENDGFAETCFTCGHSLVAIIKLGTLLSSRYEILSPLGRGGMGVVYRAHDRVLDETVAIKVLRPNIAREPDLARRFRSEIKLARRVSHRNVCRIHEYGEEGGLRYISMEFIDGVDFRQVLRDSGPLPPDEGFEVAIQAAKGLQAIHDVGVIHRDLKTPNIMRDNRRLIRLMDFGIAKEWAEEGTPATATGHVVGTPEYMSPEQVRGEKVDFRSDFYALGVVLFEIFTGRVPFKGDSAANTMLKHLHEPPPLDGPEAARIPPALVPVLRQMLAKRPDERHASARDIVEALRQARLQAFPAVRPTPGPMPISTATAPEPDILPAMPATPVPTGTGTAVTATFPGAHPPASGAAIGKAAPASSPHPPARPEARPSGAITPRARRGRPWLLAAAALAVPVVVYLAIRGGGSVTSPASSLPLGPPQTASPTEASSAPNADGSVVPSATSTTIPPLGDLTKAHEEPAAGSRATMAPPATLEHGHAALGGPRASTAPPPSTQRALPRPSAAEETLAGPAPAPPEASSPGSLVVSSTPTATIVVDGQARGRTPATIADVSPGRHTLVLTADDGRVFQEDVAVPAGGRVERNHRFVGFGSLSITSDIWVNVGVDAGPTRPTPVRIERLVAGRHVVRASRDGYKEKVLEVDIQEGETRRVSISLEPQ